MKNDNTRIWRLGLPDDWEPDGYWCVSFQIPADTQYVDALAAVVGLLTLSKTFERDETHTGAATVAATWKKAIMLAPMTVSETCNPVPIPPIPNEAAAQDAAAVFWNTFLIPRVVQLNACATSPGDCSGCVDTIMTELTPYGASGAVRGALMQLCADLNELTTEQRAAYEAQCLYLDQFNSLSDQINSNPYDWLNQLSSWMFDWLENTSDRIINDLNVIAGLMGGGGMMGFIQDNGGIPSGGGADFGSDCEWVHVIDFAVTSDGWTNLNGWTTGTWVSAAGWQSQYSEGQYAVLDYQVVDIVRSFTVPFNMTYARMTFNLVGGDWENVNPPYYAYLASQAGSVVDTYSVPEGSDLEYGGGITSTAVSSMRIQLVAGLHNRPSHGDPGGEALLTQLEIHGIGFNPWE